MIKYILFTIVTFSTALATAENKEIIKNLKSLLPEQKVENLKQVMGYTCSVEVTHQNNSITVTASYDSPASPKAQDTVSCTLSESDGNLSQDSSGQFKNYLQIPENDPTTSGCSIIASEGQGVLAGILQVSVVKVSVTNAQARFESSLTCELEKK